MHDDCLPFHAEMPSNLTPTRAPRGGKSSRTWRRRILLSPFSDPTLMQQDTYPQILQCMGITMVPLGCTGHGPCIKHDLPTPKGQYDFFIIEGSRHNACLTRPIRDEERSPEGHLGRVRTAINQT